MALPRKNANLGQVINVSGTVVGNTISVPSSGTVNIIGTGNFAGLLVNGTGVSISGHGHNISDISSFSSSNLAARVSDETGSELLVFNNSPILTGVPLAPTASSGTNTNQIASTAFVRTEISNLVASAPATLDTLNELATALGNDANFSTTITNNLAGKANLSGASFTGSISAPTGNFTVLQQNGVGVSTTTHTHGNITSSGTVGSTSGLAVVTTSNGTITTSSNLSFDTNSLSINSRYTEKVSQLSIVSSGLTIPLSSGNLFTINLNSSISGVTLSNVPSTSGVAIGFTLIFTADGTARSVTWPNSIKWAGGTVPTLTSTNAKRDVLSFVSTDNGTSYLGFVGGQNY